MLIKGRVGYRCALATRSWRAVWRLALWASASALGAACCAQTVQVPWTPSQLSALELWYDASDASSVSYSTVSQQIELWRDKSGKGRDAAQASGSNQPRYNQATLNGLQVVRFDGDDRLLADVPAGTFPSSFHVIAVFYRWGDVLATTSGPLARNIGLYAAPFDMYNSRRHIGNGSSYTIVSNTATSTYNMTSPTILACSATGSSYHEHLNGTLRVSTSGSYNYSDAAPNVVLASNNSGTNLRGDIAEICAISSLDDADRQRLEGYLAHKWGLTANLPTGHPYKTAAPLAEVAPLVHWKLDETSGTTFANSGSLGSAANAVAVGTVQRDQAPLPVDGGRAVRLETAEITTNGNVSGLNLPHTFQARTVEVWFRAESIGGRQMIYCEGANVRGNAIYLDNGTLHMTAYNRASDGPGAPWGGNASTPPVTLTCAAPILPGVTYHVAMVLDGNEQCTGTLAGYLNGASFGSTTGVGWTYSHSQVRVGTSGAIYLHDNILSGNNLYFNGDVDDVKIWDEALPASYFADVYRTQWGLVGHWKFDETSGTIAYDSSGLGNHGTLINGPVFTAGKHGNGVLFDGVNDYVSANVPITPSFSVALWGKSTTPTWNQYGWLASARGANGFIVHPWPNGVEIQFYVVTSSSFVPANIKKNVNDITAWHHYAMTWDADSRMFSAYVDGELVKAEVRTNIPRGSSNLNVYFGKDDFGSRFGAGMVDDVRIYTRAITHAEINEVLTPQTPDPTNALIAHWPLDETSGTTANDASGNELHGTYVGVQLADKAPHPAAGPAPRFDGVSSYVRLGTINASFAQGFSAAFWAKPTHPTSNERLLELASDSAGTNRIRLQRNGSANELAFGLLNSGDTLRVITAPAGLETNRWQHYVATIQANGQGTLYVNGQPVANGALTLPASVSRASCYLGIGVGQTNRFSGNLADVRLYNYPLTPAEIADIYGLVGWYRCEEASGSVAADSSGKENHAAVVGTAQWSAGLKEGSGALRLDGNTYLRVDQIPFEGPHAAIAGWAKLEAVDGAAADLANLGEHLVLRLDDATGGRGTTALGYSGAGYGTAASQRFYEAAGWRHYAAVLDGSTGQVALYLDGVKLATATAATGLTFNELVSQVTFGAATNGASDYRLKGWVDDLRIYNRPLSKAELRTLYFGRFNPGPRIIQWREVE